MGMIPARRSSEGCENIVVVLDSDKSLFLLTPIGPRHVTLSLPMAVRLEVARHPTHSCRLTSLEAGIHFIGSTEGKLFSATLLNTDLILHADDSLSGLLLLHRWDGRYGDIDNGEADSRIQKGQFYFPSLCCG